VAIIPPARSVSVYGKRYERRAGQRNAANTQPHPGVSPTPGCDLPEPVWGGLTPIEVAVSVAISGTEV